MFSKNCPTRMFMVRVLYHVLRGEASEKTLRARSSRTAPRCVSLRASAHTGVAIRFSRVPYGMCVIRVTPSPSPESWVFSGDGLCCGPSPFDACSVIPSLLSHLKLVDLSGAAHASKPKFLFCFSRIDLSTLLRSVQTDRRGDTVSCKRAAARSFAVGEQLAAPAVRGPAREM